LKIFPFCHEALQVWVYRASCPSSGTGQGTTSPFPRLVAESSPLPSCNGKEQRWQYLPLNPAKVLHKLQSTSIPFWCRSTGVTSKVHKVLSSRQAVLRDLAVEVFSWLPLF